jgi:hypothetical protein
LGWRFEGYEAMLNREQPDVLFFNGNGQHNGYTPRDGIKLPAAVRFALDGDALRATVLWNGVTGGAPKREGGPVGMVCQDGKLFLSNGVVVDAATGKAIAGASAPLTYHVMLRSEKYVVGLTKKAPNAKPPVRSALLSVCTLDGKPAASMVLTRTPHTPEQRASLLACSVNEEWGNFSYGWGLALGGDHIYVRSVMNVVCIGAKAPTDAGGK